VADHVYAMVVPGSGIVKEQAEAEGLDKILVEAGFDWREPGCSMCLAMNPDKLLPQERCASTSNRNFEGRQGNGGRTHLVSPAMAAAAAITGTLADVRKVGQSDDIDTETDSKDFLDAGDVVAPMPKKGKGTAQAGGGGMPKFTVLKGKAAALDLQNIDTDMIIPKQFLKTIKRTGLASRAFYEMRYNEDGSRARRLRAEQARVPRLEDPRGGRQLRLRLLPRARALGHQRHGHPLRHLHLLRGHLLQQLLQERHAPHPAARGAGARAHGGRRRGRRAGGGFGKAGRGAPRRRPRSRSTWTPSARTAC